MSKRILLKLGQWLIESPPPGLSLRLLLLLLSLENRKTRRVFFQRPTLKRLLGIKNDFILTQAIKTLERRELIVVEDKTTSRRRKTTYRVLLKCPVGETFFFIPQDHFSKVAPNGHKQSGPALRLTGNGLRLLLYLHDVFSKAQIGDEELKNGISGGGIVKFNSTDAHEKLKFRNFYRYFHELSKAGLLEPYGLDFDRAPSYLLTEPYLKKRTIPSCSDPPEIVIDETGRRILIKNAEILGLINSQNDQKEISKLIIEYGFEWVEDALFVVHCKGDAKSGATGVIEIVKGILNNWMGYGKMIVFPDKYAQDRLNRECEELANLFFGRRPWMLEHIELSDQIQFLDTLHAEALPNPLAIEDFPRGKAYSRAKDRLRQKYLVQPEFEGNFDSLCWDYGLKWVGDAYMIIREWSISDGPQTERQKHEWVKNKLWQWQHHQRYSYFSTNGRRAFSLGPSIREEYENKWDAKVYAVRDFPSWKMAPE
jgi:hypothetical protein